MQRLSALVLGGAMLALGIVWFFTSAIDEVVLSLAGKRLAGEISPLSKMMFTDTLSQMFAGLVLMGLLLLALALVPPDDHSGEDHAGPVG